MHALFLSLMATPIALHAEAPEVLAREADEIIRELGIAIERRTGSRIEISHHAAIEGPANASRCARTLRGHAGVRQVLFVRLSKDPSVRVGARVDTRVTAELIEGPESEPRQIAVEIARGPGRTLSLAALAFLAFPQTRGTYADIITLPVIKKKQLEAAIAVGAHDSASASFELTVEIDQPGLP